MTLPALTVWYRPSEALCWVLRGESGRIWAFANIHNAWVKARQPDWRHVRQQLDQEPTCEVMPPEQAQLVAALLGIPGARADDALVKRCQMEAMGELIEARRET